MKISVVIPTCNRNEDLLRCLDSLEPAIHSLSSAEFECIVTDDGRAYPAKNIIEEKFPWANYFQGPADGPAANRNHGANHATGDWIAFIDDDCVADSKWLQQIGKQINNGTADVIEGRTIIPDKKDSPFLHGVENHHGGGYWTCNLAVERKKFLEIGAFDEDFKIAGGEDMEFAWRFQKLGLRAVFDPEVLVFHPQRPYSLKGFLKRVPQLRWSLLYFQKIGEAPPINASAITVFAYIFKKHVVGSFRRAWYHLSKNKDDGWKTKLFHIIWPFVVMPYQFPHLIYWEFKFRKMRPQLNFRYEPK